MARQLLWREVFRDTGIMFDDPKQIEAYPMTPEIGSLAVEAWLGCRLQIGKAATKT